MPPELTVNSRWILKRAAARDHVLSALESALERCAITWSVEDSPDVGALGMPRWTVFVFHAQHGYPDSLDRDVERCLGAHTRLGPFIEQLTIQ
jgi:hypothetical protein